MKSAIFSASSDCYQISNVVYAGPVAEIPEAKRKSECTHSFKMITVAGTVYCYFKDQDSARKARGALGAMMESMKPELFRTGRECLDPKKVVSYSRIIKLKNTDDGMTHGFVVTVETLADKTNQIWFTYKSEDYADKARRALYAIIQAANNVKQEKKEESVSPSIVAEKAAPVDDLPF